MHHINRRQEKRPVIVTGSSGLIGTAVIKALSRHYPMVGFDRAGPPYPPPEAECISVDMTDSESIRRGLERVCYAYGEHIASVIHLAAYYDYFHPYRTSMLLNRKQNRVLLDVASHEDVPSPGKVYAKENHVVVTVA